MTLNLDRSDIKRAHTEMNGHEAVAHPVVWRESESATEINRILNHPDVFPFISLPDQQPFDATELVRDPRFVFLMAEGGVIMFAPDPEPTSGMYEVHTNFLEDSRGKHARAASLESYRWMFTHTNCVLLVTGVPKFNLAAEAFCRTVGASLWFERARKWPTKDGLVDVRFYSLSLMDWMRKHPAPLIEAGQAFHKRLEEEYARIGFVHEAHQDEDSHDLAAGLCAEMMYGGQPEKAAIIYNRWARVAGYRQINIVSQNPLVVDIGESILHVTGKTFRVLQCRSAQQ